MLSGVNADAKFEAKAQTRAERNAHVQSFRRTPGTARLDGARVQSLRHAPGTARLDAADRVSIVALSNFPSV